MLAGVVAGRTQRTQQHLHRTFAGAAACDGRNRRAHALILFREEQLFLACEVIEEGAGTDLRRGGDVRHRCFLITSVLEKVDSSLEEGSAGTFSFAITEGGWRHAGT